MSKIACFIGHRKIVETKELTEQLYKIIEKLITNEKVETFLFGSKSAFNSLCYEQVSDLKEKYPFIKRIFVRAEYPVINNSYIEYLHKYYEDTYYPSSVMGAGKAAYIKRNYEMIDKSNFCVFYFNEDCLPKGRKSGTKIVLDYAVRKRKNVFILPIHLK